MTHAGNVEGFASGEPVEGAVDEFDPAGQFVDQITGTSEGRRLHGAVGLAADPKGDLYVLDAGYNEASKQFEHAVDGYGPDLFVPGVRLGEPTDGTQTSATLNGSVDPDGRALSGCEFEYVTETAFNADLAEGHDGFSDLGSGGSVPCSPAAATIPADERYEPVEAKIAALSEGTVYRYRLTAAASGALAGSAFSASLAFTAPTVPVVSSTSVSNTSSQYAELHAQIDPRGAASSYHFEYDTRGYAPGEGPHGLSVPVPDASIGSGGANGSALANVAQQIGPLTPGTAYYFRVVAENAIGPAAGGPATEGSFTTLPAPVAGLPDDRAYELVTPPEKGDADDMFAAPESERGVFLNQDTGFASESGERFLISTEAAFGAFPASERNAYVFSRTPTGWGYASLASPSLGVQGLQIGPFDPTDFSQLALNDTAGSPFSLAGARLENLVGPPGGPYDSAHVDAAVREGEGTQGVEGNEHTEVLGGSHDLSHVVLESESHTLASGASEQDADTTALYEWAGGPECGSESASCELVNVTSEGKLVSRCGAVLGQGHIPGTRHGAVSADGSAVIFTRRPVRRKRRRQRRLLERQNAQRPRALPAQGRRNDRDLRPRRRRPRRWRAPLRRVCRRLRGRLKGLLHDRGRAHHRRRGHP